MSHWQKSFIAPLNCIPIVLWLHPSQKLRVIWSNLLLPFFPTDRFFSPQAKLYLRSEYRLRLSFPKYQQSCNKLCHQGFEIPLIFIQFNQIYVVFLLSFSSLKWKGAANTIKTSAKIINFSSINLQTSLFFLCYNLTKKWHFICFKFYRKCS